MKLGFRIGVGLAAIFAGTALSRVVANPCYQNTAFGPQPTCFWSAIGPIGPCPWGPSIFNVPPTCGFYTTSVTVPTGTFGNKPSGRMTQGNATRNCRNGYFCSKKIIGLSPIWPPVANVACISGAPVALGTATSWGAIGGACPPTNPSGGGNGSN